MDDQNQTAHNTDADLPPASPVPVEPEAPRSPAVSYPYPPPSAPMPNYAAPLVPMPSYAAQVVDTNAWAVISLVASILGWVGLFGLGGIVGVVTGLVARNQIKARPGAQAGDGLALAGIILGAVNIVFGCLVVLCGMVALFAMFGWMPYYSR